MRWVTRSHLHLDRVATPWLIRRFVDPAAVFTFTTQTVPPRYEGAIAFGFPGVVLSSHDEHGTCFRKVMTQYELDEPALQLMERIIASGVAHALKLRMPAELTDDQALLGAALDLLGLGLAVVLDDERHLEIGMAVFEAIYALCRVEQLAPAVRADTPGPLPERIPYLRSAIGLPVE